MNKKALVIGISGQDGAYLSKELLDKGYEIYSMLKFQILQGCTS